MLIKKGREMKIWQKINLKIMMFFGTMIVPLMAEDNPLSKSGVETRKTLSTTIQSYLWLVPLAVLGVAGVFIYFTRKKIKKDEEGQNANELTTSQLATRYVIAGIAGIITAYLVLGIFGLVFLDMGLFDVWKYFVVKPLRGLIGLQD